MSTKTSLRVTTGLERVLSDPPAGLQNARCGLLMNQASVDHRWQYASHRLRDLLPPKRLIKLFSPQHGTWGVQQANMLETSHDVDDRLQIPVYSLYSETRRPTDEMLEDIDLLLIDLQDVGTRVYTYVWTVLHCLQACADNGIRVCVLDRPNPLGGRTIEGPCLKSEYSSFVGMLPIPMRHGMTIGELALLGNRWLQIGADLTVIPMVGWQRDMLFPDTGLPWVAPSPNMPRFESALVFPGQVLLEGTNLSEGRGTTMPFELVGAPFIDPWQLQREWTAASDCGIVAREVHFAPTFDKWKGETCRGLAWHWDRAEAVRSYAATITMLAAVRSLWPQEFAWSPPPYEYELEKPPIDILSGSDQLRRRFEVAVPGMQNEWNDLIFVDEEDWWAKVGPFLLYD